MSTTKQLDNAKEFYQNQEDNAVGSGVICIIHLTGKGAVDIQNKSVYQGEAEVLVPVNTRFKVLKPVTEKYYRKRVRAEEVTMILSEAQLTDSDRAEIAEEEQRPPEIQYPPKKWEKIRCIELEEVDGPGAHRRERLNRKREKNRLARERLLGRS
jgi:hypothetical protein